MLVFLLGSFGPGAYYAPALSHTYTDTTTSSKTVRTVYSATSFIAEKMDVFDSLRLGDWGLSKKVFEIALRGMYKLVRNGQIKSNILSIVDFSQPSMNKRLYVIDLDNYFLLYNTLVAHGAKSGKEMANLFSNKSSSHKSSLGFYVTGETYDGCNGYSLKLRGMEKGINDYALKRGIVLHGADYVSEEYGSSQGYIGRSYGCPALPAGISHEVIDILKEGTCLFIYHPSATYKAKSKMLK
jgi:hypothetical protein